MDSSDSSRRRFLSGAVAAGGALLAAAPEARASARPRTDTRTPARTGTWPPGLEAAVRRAMPAAVDLARTARYPYGAVLVDVAGGSVVTGARNDSEHDPTAHAEVALLRAAAAAGLHLPDHAVVTTAEPCAMCAGALLWSGVRAVAYGTSVEKLISYGVPQIDISFTEIAGRSLLSRTPPALAGDVRCDLTDPLYRDLKR
ncbi:nucleoside deaminase [Streptomyces roseoverticillatus]|uniref:nucleoside deaminase n=1 Tax=Streptomyces roseoverticillatus TaxID=66429 RepID=UPI001F1A7949|nr:deaminase [Streptomyces roseoverticillatus]MCF3106692.1 nucleoside deaminase [Streptomyces roseoverticillatus]